MEYERNDNNLCVGLAKMLFVLCHWPESFPVNLSPNGELARQEPMIAAVINIQPCRVVRCIFSALCQLRF